MINYDAMSDFEINLKIAIYMKKNVHNVQSSNNKLGSINIVRPHGGIRTFNPCNNPSDMMPIAFEHGIGLISDDDRSGYCATNGWLHHTNSIYGDDFQHYDKNPLRAAAICFLKMMEAR